MQVSVLAGLRVGVDESGRQPGRGVQQSVLRVDSDLVGFNGSGVAAEFYLAFCP